ncbi:hypothetical protein KSP40_PGU020871 [Platanthera guangdongensis]|uniref:Uncharacterized protein n=1 Tax=Platanthera guangdongensis TaxID=2320717 RepID=A0ABR2LDA8_9ASPA
MKNLYPKGKGRIHPSPSAAPANPRGEAIAVLRLLPAAILALIAVLGNDDKEVLAYLITRSIGMPEEAAEQRRFGRPGELHTSLFGCGCFDCYTTFWSRWDCSPDRELIHQAIEAFEDHLANSERAGAGAGTSTKGRRRERRVGDAPEKGKKKGKDKEKPNDEISTIEPIIDETSQKPPEEVRDEAEEAENGGDREEVFEEATSEASTEMPACQPSAPVGERRKGWADVTAIFNSRLWSLWSPGD